MTREKKKPSPKTKGQTVKSEKKQSNKEKNLGGRPRIDFNFELFEQLCTIQCTLVEISGVMKISEDTIESRCKEHYGAGFSDIYKKLSADGKMSLRRTQFRLAEDNPTMAIWLGKQYLGQKDKQEIDQNLRARITEVEETIIDPNET